MFQLKQNNRIKLILVIVFAIFFLILFKVFYIQVIKYDELNSLANNLWVRNLPVEADRGKILDRNGKVIVDNQTTVGLFFVPNQIVNKELVAKKISNVLNVSFEDMLGHVSKRTVIERVHPEGRNLSFEEAEAISAFDFDGVYLLKESKRNYIYKDVLSHVIGYTGIDNQGLSGLELKYDDILTGKDGSIKYYSDGRGNRLELAEIYDEPSNGKDIYLTVDLDIQLALENELNNAMSKYEAEGAIGIVMSPKTGEILAMSSKPSFEPANYQKYSEEVINRNLAIWSNFEPGSTFKIVTLAAAVNEGLVNVFEDKYYDSGKIKVANATLHCWKHKGHGSQTFLQVVENSCNPGFVVLGQKLGKEKLFSYIKALGFGSKTGIDLNGEATGILFKDSQIGPVELATTAFGQGVSVTAIQQVASLSAVINDGKLFEPFIVLKYGDNEVSPTLKKENIITSETSNVVRYSLESVVANGSGRNAYIEGYRVGGKTGTAQKVGSDGRYMVGNYVLSFIGFMPADDPEYVIYIAIDHAKGVTQYGGVVSAPIARNVFEEIINIYDLEESDEGLPRVYRWGDVRYVTIPEILGLSKKKASSLLRQNGFMVEYSGSGDTVVDSSPMENTKAKEGSTVKLLLN